VKPKKTALTPEQRFAQALRTCWPALKGSLAKVYKPAFARLPDLCPGRQHPNYLLSFTEQGHRVALRAKAMVPVFAAGLAMDGVLSSAYEWPACCAIIEPGTRRKRPAVPLTRPSPGKKSNPNPSGIGETPAATGAVSGCAPNRYLPVANRLFSVFIIARAGQSCLNVTTPSKARSSQHPRAGIRADDLAVSRTNSPPAQSF